MELRNDTNIISLVCESCGTPNFVATCTNCSRSFVITSAHLNGEPREFKAEAVLQVPEDLALELCDFCSAKAQGKLVEAVNAGMRQRTCPSCHTEFLSRHGR